VDEPPRHRRADLTALTPSVTTQRRLALYRNVRPLHFPITDDRDRRWSPPNSCCWSVRACSSAT